jgi:hypothetical protein
MRGIRRYWGYLLFFALITTAWTWRLGPVVLGAAWTVVTAYFLFQAPVFCGAETRAGQLCRNNASGIMMGCSYRQHKWQKLKFAVVPRRWRELNKGLWASGGKILATLGTIVAIISGIVSTILAVAAA